jgi:hypothetical protein
MQFHLLLRMDEKLCSERKGTTPFGNVSAQDVQNYI